MKKIKISYINDFIMCLSITTAIMVVILAIVFAVHRSAIKGVTETETKTYWNNENSNEEFNKMRYEFASAESKKLLTNPDHDVAGALSAFTEKASAIHTYSEDEEVTKKGEIPTSAIVIPTLAISIWLIINLANLFCKVSFYDSPEFTLKKENKRNRLNLEAETIAKKREMLRKDDYNPLLKP